MTAAERLEKLVMSSGVGKRQVRGEIARICDISPQAVQQWFSGSTGSPKPENMAAIAKAFNGNLMWIITGEGPMKVGAPARQTSDVLKLFDQLSDEAKSRILKMIRREIGE
jgi:transcriptional regulator with XRE-family HTH domain